MAVGLEAFGALIGGSALMLAALTIDVSIPYLGVPLNVVAAAVAGTIAGFAFSTREVSRLKLFQVSFACVVLGCAMTTVLAEIMTSYFKWEVLPQQEAALALITSCMSRWFWPAFLERIGPFLDRIPFLKKRPPGDK